MTKKSLEQFHYKNNRFQQLRGFCYTVQAGSMSAAAKKMKLSQGAVSLQIKSLERDLGVQLFLRDKNKATLTKEGRMFYAHSVPHIYGADEMFEDFISNLKNEKSQTISIAASNVSICYILPKYVKKFETKFPKTKFAISNITRSEAVRRLLENEVDMLLYSTKLSEIPSELEFVPIAEYKPILLTQKNHPLSKKKKVTMEEIKKYKLLRLDKNFMTIPNFDEVAKHYGLKTKIEFEMANYEILKKFVREDIGIAILSDICIEEEDLKKLSVMSLEHYFPKILYGILMKKGKAPHGLLKDFVEMMVGGRS
jgi:DNA-binding transcriptional LysR family regulator